MSEDAAVGGVESSSSFGAATADESQNDQVANLMTLLTLNRAYQEAIVDKLAALKTLLAQNQLKQARTMLMLDDVVARSHLSRFVL